MLQDWERKQWGLRRNNQNNRLVLGIKTYYFLNVITMLALKQQTSKFMKYNKIRLKYHRKGRDQDITSRSRLSTITIVGQHHFWHSARTTSEKFMCGGQDYNCKEILEHNTFPPPLTLPLLLFEESDEKKLTH